MKSDSKLFDSSEETTFLSEVSAMASASDLYHPITLEARVTKLLPSLKNKTTPPSGGVSSGEEEYNA